MFRLVKYFSKQNSIIFWTNINLETLGRSARCWLLRILIPLLGCFRFFFGFSLWLYRLCLHRGWRLINITIWHLRNRDHHTGHFSKFHLEPKPFWARFEYLHGNKGHIVDEPMVQKENSSGIPIWDHFGSFRGSTTFFYIIYSWTKHLTNNNFSCFKKTQLRIHSWEGQLWIHKKTQKYKWNLQLKQHVFDIFACELQWSTSSSSPSLTHSSHCPGWRIQAMIHTATAASSTATCLEIESSVGWPLNVIWSYHISSRCFKIGDLFVRVLTILKTKTVAMMDDFWGWWFGGLREILWYFTWKTKLLVSLKR